MVIHAQDIQHTPLLLAQGPAAGRVETALSQVTGSSPISANLRDALAWTEAASNRAVEIRKRVESIPEFLKSGNQDGLSKCLDAIDAAARKECAPGLAPLSGHFANTPLEILVSPAGLQTTMPLHFPDLTCAGLGLTKLSAAGSDATSRLENARRTVIASTTALARSRERLLLALEHRELLWAKRFRPGQPTPVRQKALLQTAQGSLEIIRSILGRIALRAAETGAGAPSDPISQETELLTRIAESTEYRGMNLLTGRFAMGQPSYSLWGPPAGMGFHFGSRMDDRITAYFPDGTARGLGIDATSPRATLATQCTQAVTAIDGHLARLRVLRERLDLVEERNQIHLENTVDIETPLPLRETRMAATVERATALAMKTLRRLYDIAGEYAKESSEPRRRLLDIRALGLEAELAHFASTVEFNGMNLMAGRFQNASHEMPWSEPLRFHLKLSSLEVREAPVGSLFPRSLRLQWPESEAKDRMPALAQYRARAESVLADLDRKRGLFAELVRSLPPSKTENTIRSTELAPPFQNAGALTLADDALLRCEGFLEQIGAAATRGANPALPTAVRVLAAEECRRAFAGYRVALDSAVWMGTPILRGKYDHAWGENPQAKPLAVFPPGRVIDGYEIRIPNLSLDALGFVDKSGKDYSPVDSTQGLSILYLAQRAQGFLARVRADLSALDECMRSRRALLSARSVVDSGSPSPLQSQRLVLIVGDDIQAALDSFARLRSLAEDAADGTHTMESRQQIQVRALARLSEIQWTLGSSRLRGEAVFAPAGTPFNKIAPRPVQLWPKEKSPQAASNAVAVSVGYFGMDQLQLSEASVSTPDAANRCIGMSERALYYLRTERQRFLAAAEELEFTQRTLDLQRKHGGSADAEMATFPAGASADAVDLLTAVAARLRDCSFECTASGRTSEDRMRLGLRAERLTASWARIAAKLPAAAFGPNLTRESLSISSLSISTIPQAEKVCRKIDETLARLSEARKRLVKP